ncbi:glycerate kinase [Salininema proteolyticum]|uniref:Glycerate kinase n=1 Tax=Salininema proteolyticum TaxID=1607685 RepID=A0ABV8TW94_9ACTN
MRVLIAPESITRSAPQAAKALAEGWTSVRPGDTVDRLPLSTGGRGFLATVGALDGDMRIVDLTVPGSGGSSVTAYYLSDGTTAYLEAAHTCSADADPATASSTGLGHLMGHAVESGHTRLVIGLGGTLTQDLGMGMLGALGWSLRDADGRVLHPSPQYFTQAASLSYPSREKTVGLTAPDGRPVAVTAVTDTSRPLSELRGDPRLEAPQVYVASLVQALLGQHNLQGRSGTASGGGLGFALAALGADLVPAVAYIGESFGLDQHVREADLVVTGTDAQSDSLASHLLDLADKFDKEALVMAPQTGAERLAESTAVYRLPQGSLDLRALASRAAREWESSRAGVTARRE